MKLQPVGSRGVAFRRGGAQEARITDIRDGVKSTHKLVREHENGLEREVAVAHAEEVFERGAEEVDDHDVVVALSARPVDPGDTGTTHECLVDLALLLERRGLCNGGLELDGDFLACDGVDALEDGS